MPFAPLLKKRFLVLLLPALALLTACEDVIYPELDQAEPRLVVEGLVTNTTARPSYVKLSLSAPYYQSGQPNPVSDATVTVTDNLGTAVIFTQESPGFYRPPADYQGEVGRTYSLRVEYAGKAYEAVAELRRTGELDTIYYEYVENELGRDKGYYVSVNLQDPAGLGETYKFDAYVNGKPQNDGSNFLVFNDDVFDGNYIEELDFFEPVSLGDTVRVEIQSLSREGYLFYQAVQAQVNRGFLFDAAPANVPSNISNGGLGYFGASAVNGIEIKIE